MPPRIQSPIVSGTGVEVIHQCLAQNIPDYHCSLVHPVKASLPLLPKRQTNQTDIVHTIPDMGAQFFSKNAQNIITFHGYTIDEPFISQQASVLRRAYYRHVLRPRIIKACKKADVITAVSRYLADLVTNDLALNRKVEVIYNGVDTSLFRPTHSIASTSKLKVLYVGKMNDRKGYDIVDKLSLELSERITFLVLGKGKVRPNPHITYLDRVPHKNMMSIYNDADVLLLPSSREGFSLVLAEAMACGRAIVSTDTAAIPELVCEGKGGFLCPPRSVAAFRQALITLASDPGRVSQFGKFNRDRIVNNFSLDQMLQGYQTLFDQSVDR